MRSLWEDFLCRVAAICIFLTTFDMLKYYVSVLLSWICEHAAFERASRLRLGPWITGYQECGFYLKRNHNNYTGSKSTDYTSSCFRAYVRCQLFTQLV